MTDLQIHPVTRDRFKHLEHLFGNNGAFCGCWCMDWRLTRKEMEDNKSAGNRLAMKKLVDSGCVPGILAYDEGVPVGWCAVARRNELAKLNRSRVLKPVDDQPVWSITCFFVAKTHRNSGMMEALIRGAVEYVWSQGGRIVEAYPHTPVADKASPVTIYTGLPTPFERVGFETVKQASKAKLIMRFELSE